MFLRVLDTRLERGLETFFDNPDSPDALRDGITLTFDLDTRIDYAWTGSFGQSGMAWPTPARKPWSRARVIWSSA